MVKTGLDLLRGPPRTFDILMYLLGKNEEEVGSVMSNLNLATYTFYSAVERLKLLGFLYDRREKGFPPHTYVALTNKGKEAAKLLHPMAELVGSTLEGLKLELADLDGMERTEDQNKRIIEILGDLQEITFTMGELSEAEGYAKRVADIASALGDNKSLSMSLRTLGKVHYGRGRFEESESEFSESIRLSSKIDDMEGVAEARYVLGAIREDAGEYDEAMDLYQKAGEASKSAGNESLEARADLGYGRMLGKKGRFEDSLKKMKESIQILEKLEDYDELPRAYGNAGATAFYIDLDESLRWHEKSMEMANRNGDLRMLGYSLCNISGILNKKGEPKKALAYLGEASEISEKLDEKRMMCSVNIQMGWAHRLAKGLNDSDRCFELAVQVAEKYDLAYELGDALLNWAYVDVERGHKREARTKLKRALEVFDDLGNQTRVNKIKKTLRSLSQ